MSDRKLIASAIVAVALVMAIPGFTVVGKVRVQLVSYTPSVNIGQTASLTAAVSGVRWPTRDCDLSLFFREAWPQAPGGVRWTTSGIRLRVAQLRAGQIRFLWRMPPNTVPGRYRVGVTCESSEWTCDDDHCYHDRDRFRKLFVVKP